MLLLHIEAPVVAVAAVAESVILHIMVPAARTVVVAAAAAGQNGRENDECSEQKIRASSIRNTRDVSTSRGSL